MTDFIYELKKLAETEKNNKAIGRFQGWALCNRGPVLEWIRNDFMLAKEILEKHNIQLIRWSTLSFDKDDYNDFAVRIGVNSV